MPHTSFQDVSMQCVLDDPCSGVILPPNPWKYTNPGQTNNVNAFFDNVLCVGANPPGPFMAPGGDFENLLGKWNGTVSDLMLFTAF